MEAVLAGLSGYEGDAEKEPEQVNISQPVGGDELQAAAIIPPPKSVTVAEFVENGITEASEESTASDGTANSVATGGMVETGRRRLIKRGMPHWNLSDPQEVAEAGWATLMRGADRDHLSYVDRTDSLSINQIYLYFELSAM